MSTIIKQGFRGTLLSYLGIILGYVNWVLFIPLFLDKEEMGLVRVLMDAGLLLATIFGLGIPQTVIKFYPYQTGGKFSRNFLSTFAFLAIVAGLSFIPFYFLFKIPIQQFFAEKAPMFNEYSWALIPIIFFSISYDLFDSLNKIRHDISASIFIKEVLFRILILLVVLGYGFNFYSFDALVIFLILCYGIQAFGMAAFFFFKWEPDKSSMIPQKPGREQLKYMFFLFWGSGGAVLVTQIDSIMTGGMKGLDYAAVYGMAIFMSSVVYIPFRALTSISSSIISKHFAENKKLEIDKMYKASSSNLFLIGGVIFLLIWWNVDFLFALIPEKQDSTIRFADGKWVLFILGMARLLDMITGLNGIILVNSKYYYMHFITMPILALFTIVLNFILIPYFDIIGAALGALLSILIFNLVRYLILWFKLKMQPFSSRTLILIALFSASLFLSFVIHLPNNYFQIIVSFISIGFLFILPAYYFKISPELNALSTKMISLIRSKF